MDKTYPRLRKDLEFFPVQHQDQQMILVQDHLGLVQKGKAILASLSHFLILINGTHSIQDLQMALMRQRGGMLVETDEGNTILDHLDEAFLLDSERFRTARAKLIEDFTVMRVRPCSHGGVSYPDDPNDLKRKLDEILNSEPQVPKPEGNIIALISPHIDLSAGQTVYSSAYQYLRFTAPSRIVILGVGHQLGNHLFSLTEKDFRTPFGIIKNDPSIIRTLRKTGADIVAPDDFAHRSEHSIEFQIIFLQHILEAHSPTIIPILCGSFQSSLREYSRETFIEEAGPFLDTLRQIIEQPDKDTLLLAGIDLSHIGPKFGNEMPAKTIEKQSEAHDRNLLQCLIQLDPDSFWKESRAVKNQYNVCGFSALACLLEVLPACKGEILKYDIWHEAPTQSAVSFAAVLFTA